MLKKFVKLDKNTLKVLLFQKQTLYTQALFFLILLDTQNINFITCNNLKNFLKW